MGRRRLNAGSELQADVAHLPQQLRDQARRAGGGWLDEVVGNHAPGVSVPMSAIKGSWRVDANGDLTGDYVPNPRFGQRSRGCPLHETGR